MIKLDQDILEAAERIQVLRDKGLLFRVKQITFHLAPGDGKIKKVHTESKEIYIVGEEKL